MTPPSLPGTPVHLAGRPVTLLPEGAVLDPASGTLLVADLHLGKSACFRRAGLPVPEAVDDDTLARLADLVERRPAQRVVILGDLMHAPLPETHPLFERIRARLAGLDAEFVLVAGNHDRQAARFAELMGVTVREDGLRLGRFLLRHEPAPEADAHVLAGHLHPVVRLNGRADSVRLPCFWVSEGVTVLPAFGAFTGGWTVRPARGDRVFVCNGREVHEVPLPSRRTGAGPRRGSSSAAGPILDAEGGTR